jgi:hypothetical protein
MAIWSVAKYTYDEVGNAVRIDSYDEEGNLIAWCINTYAE